MRVDAEDLESGIKYVQFYIDDTLLTTKPKEPYEMNYTLTQSPGVYTLTVKATDMAGNSAEDKKTLTVE